MLVDTAPDAPPAPVNTMGWPMPLRVIVRVATMRALLAVCELPTSTPMKNAPRRLNASTSSSHVCEGLGVPGVRGEPDAQPSYQSASEVSTTIGMRPSRKHPQP